MKRRKHRPKESTASDPLVPIHVDRLRAVMEALTIRKGELARRAGEIQQTVSALLKGTGPRKVRRSRVTRLAEALRMPEGYLLGEPVMFPGGPLVQTGYEYLYSPKTELAASRLLTGVLHACERDLLQHPERMAQLSNVPLDFAAATVVEASSRLIRVKDWRQKLLHWDEKLQAERGFTEPATEDPWKIEATGLIDPPEDRRDQYPPGVKLASWRSLSRPKVDPAHEQAVLGLIAAFEHLLQPWFDNQAALNLATLEGIAHFQPQAPSSPAPPPISAIQARKKSVKPKKGKKR